MKIVHLTDTYAPKLGGIETHIERLAGLQAAAGHTVTILSAHRAGRAGQRSGTAFTVRGDTRAVRVVPALPLQTDDLAADVFHAHLSVTSPATMRTVAFLASTGAPLAVTVHSLWPRWGDAAGAVLRAVGIDQDRVAWSAVSRAAAERVESALLPGRRVDVVPNVVDTAWWHNPRPARHSTTVRAVLVGRLTTRKHVGPFLRALRAAMPPGLAVTVVGDGPRRRHLTHLVRRADLGEQVRFTGALSPRRLRELLHSSDVFVAPAPLESFGIAALEAHAAGLPVLGRCGTGLADFVTDGVDGWLAGSDADLATGLVALTRARDQLHAFQLEAQRRAATLDQAVGVACTERLYDRARFATATTTAADSLALLSAPR